MAKHRSQISPIIIRGACEHNLKSISLEIPRNSLLVFTGPSGSGKSSLAFDTIYAESERRYVESLSSSARQYLDQLHKPAIDSIDNLSPAIALSQVSCSSNPRATVGTLTEIHNYLKVLFARIGTPWCSKRNENIERQTIDNIVDKLLLNPEGTKLQILSPIVKSEIGSHKTLLKDLRKQGFSRLRIDQEFCSLEEDITLDKKVPHSIDIIYDRLAISKLERSRLREAIEVCIERGNGFLRVLVHDGDKIQELLLSNKFACTECGIAFNPPTPNLFSFNSLQGACPECRGLGKSLQINLESIIDERLSIKEGAIIPWDSKRKGNARNRRLLSSFLKRYEIDPLTPWQSLTDEVKQLILFGISNNNQQAPVKAKLKFEGVVPYLKRRLMGSETEITRKYYEQYFKFTNCHKCSGARLRKEALMVRISGKNIFDVGELPLSDARTFFKSLKLSSTQHTIAKPLLEAINTRLDFLCHMGVGYLSLNRLSTTLSGGETQRIRLAGQIAGGLSGIIYVLDEPSIGLHPRDTQQLIDTLKTLRDQGNTVLVVEHDRDIIEAADYIFELGPGAGASGGHIVAQGSPQEIKKQKCHTGDYLLNGLNVPKHTSKSKQRPELLSIKGANLNNLQNISVNIPLKKFVCVTGISGSGKSSLILDTLYPYLANSLHPNSKLPVGSLSSVTGIEQIDKVISIDQQAIGRTPRSNPATYTGLFDTIRELFSKVQESRIRGFSPGRFSFNVKGGRCERCKGAGVIKLDMLFLPPAYVECEECKGLRYNKDSLEITYKGKNIAEVLQMTVKEAFTYFSVVPSAKLKLQAMLDVGLAYLPLGQSATSLSGGEAQRVKLATELARKSTGNTLYILDEPTSGLHAIDIKALLNVLFSLLEKGNSIIVIEHNLDIIRHADWIIDLGPGAGNAGGQIVATGTIETLKNTPTSTTGKYL